MLTILVLNMEQNKGEALEYSEAKTEKYVEEEGHWLWRGSGQTKSPFYKTQQDLFVSKIRLIFLTNLWTIFCADGNTFFNEDILSSVIVQDSERT